MLRDLFSGGYSRMALNWGGEQLVSCNHRKLSLAPPLLFTLFPWVAFIPYSASENDFHA